jgi:mannose-1-phosphate guanylyltransferase
MRYAMIMAGGSGTRLWPMSREGQPKQLIRFVHRDDGSVVSLLQIAAERMGGLVPAERAYICTGERYREQIREGMAGLDDAHILGEPEPRDTVNAVAFGAAVFAKEDPDAVFAVLTADQLITPEGAFNAAMDLGFRLAEEDGSRLVTFGITPTFAATGYGYVEKGSPVVTRLSGADAAFSVARFVEKPPREKAEAYLASGRFFWNSGMFVFRASRFLELYERYMPENAAGIRKIAAAWGTGEQRAVLEKVYPTLKKTSVDYGVMEPASRDGEPIVGVEMPVEWLDVGSWPSYGETIRPDAAGNRVAGLRVASHGSSNNIVIGEGGGDRDHLVALVGCEDLIVVRTARATLVMPRGQAEALKGLHGGLGKGDR